MPYDFQVAVDCADPHTLAEMLDSITALGAATGHRPAAERLVSSLHRRLNAVRAEVAERRTGPGPSVLLLEWTDPPFAPGHWVPEMVSIAGGRPTVGSAGEKSLRVTWEEALAVSPDVVVCAPCGFDLAGSTAQARAVVASGALPEGTPVWAVDANASFARPGPRLVDGVETLARIFDPTAPPPSPYAARRVR